MAGPVACPVPANNVTTFNINNNADCVTLLQGLLQAYTNLIAGSTRVEIRFGDRTSIFNHGNATQLQALYNTIYAQCPGAQASGLPSLNPGLRARRGPPVTGVQFFPRL